MSRTISEGLQNFSLDCDFFTNKKIKVLKANFGTDGIAVYLYLLCEVYRNGFYLKVDNDFEYIIAADLNIKFEKVSEIVPFLTEHSLFDKEMFFKNKVITSKSVQQHFQTAIKERAKKTPRKVEHYWLLSADETAPYIILDGNESKSHTADTEKTVKDVTEITEKPVDKFSLVTDYYKAHFNAYAKPDELNELKQLLTNYDYSLVMECMKIAVEKNKRFIGYIRGILKNLDRQGVRAAQEFHNKGAVVSDRFF